ncbi:transporter [Caulobacter sp. 17J65-9]|uniref:transporter n=1 Tax=Caulobacter sp. 17J65-9 TaxID=2709382 RepID=UPI003204E539
MASGAHAQSAPEVAEELRRLRATLDAQAAQLAAQQAALTEQQQRLDAQAAEIEKLRSLDAASLDAMRGTGGPGIPYAAFGQAAAPMAGPARELARPVPSPEAPVAQSAEALPQQPVGEAPPETKPVPVEAIPEGAGVLTPRGVFVVEPQLDFTHGSSNRLVFRGIEIVPGIQIGVIEANDADRDTISAAAAFRYGLTNRIEVEARIPWLYRKDRVTTVQQRDDQVARTIELDGSDIGDVEVSARYQINDGRSGKWPVFVAGLRVKSDTGRGPFDVDRDPLGVATELATGSGFWGVEPSVSFLYPSDPAVIFGSLSYLAHLSKDINEDFGDGVTVGRVDPGDAINASIGFGFALNDRFSYSLGYRHSYIFETDTELNGTTFGSNEVQVGALTFGMSYALARRYSLNATFDIGVTDDAPDVRVGLRLPIRF